MPRKKGIFIVFDGIDGSGKGTHLRLAAGHLRASGIPAENVVETAEPTKGPLGMKIRELLKRGSAESDSVQLLGLYVEDRKAHIMDVIAPALKEGKIVLCDRYKYSTLAYQGAQGIPAKEVMALHKGMPVPDLAIIMDLSPARAVERIAQDRARAATDRFERPEFLKKVHAYFRRMPKFFPKEKFVYISPEGEIPDVSKQVCRAVDSVA